ncbi:MaoC family dehydratase [Cesiribacter sp. SM1]|uniref:MaoC family dehydratase n=1 Tax=Cesiribacter sp. SM1 TaxID=2861196 RepID=UPI001CD3C6F7|nr:MaoC family dehydratase [Cesiribacter sp. SM1]
MLQVGQKAQLSKVITSADIELFADLSMDMNPVHLDEEYAKTTIFKSRVSHGMLYASFISAVIANKLPGPGSIYLKQDVAFLKPVFIGDTITAVVEIVEIPKENTYRLITQCVNQNNELVVDGAALILKK